MKKKIIKNIFYILEDGAKGFEDICIEVNIPKAIKKQRRVERAHYMLTSVGSEMAKMSIAIGLAVPAAIWLKAVSSTVPEENKAARTAITVGGSILFGTGNAYLAEAVGNKLFSDETLCSNNTYDLYISHCTHRMVETYYDGKFGKGKYILLTKDCWDLLEEPEAIKNMFKLMNMKEESENDNTDNA